MNVTSKISVDLTRQNMGQRVNAVQGDGNTRYVEITLLAGGVPWTPPDGMEAAIAYMQPSGTKGLYNLLADGTAAISISGNVVAVILAPQMLTVSGTVQASLVFNDAQLNRLTTFPFSVQVVSNPAYGAQKTEDYIRLQWLEDKLDEYLRKASENMEFVGPQGPKGDKGDKGDVGPAGPAGKPGVSPTINQKGPDETGNVTLTAADVGALAVSGGDMTGEIRMNGQPISGLNDPTEDTQAARKGYVDASVRKAAPRNLLDNSDFTNPVNQRGNTSYSGSGYTIDRWENNSMACKLTVEDGHIHMQNNTKSTSTATQFIRQKIENPSLLVGKKFTIAARVKGNCRITMEGIGQVFPDYYNYQDWTTIIRTIDIQLMAGDFIAVVVQGANKSEWYCEWITLYEGEYTAETLPEYQPKGYVAELAECQRYYQAFLNNAFLGTVVVDIDGVNFQGSIPCGEMRVRAPTIIGSIAAWDGLVATAISSVTTFQSQGNGMRINGSLSSNVTQGKFLILYAAAEVAFSADL